MFRCFRLTKGIDSLLDSNLKIDGIESEQKHIYKELIDYYSGNIINGLSTTKKNFPCKNMDVFISHAHKDREVAYKLAAKLSSLGLTCFIDSTVWGNVNDLILEMDDKYAYKPEKKTYDYKTRNITTTHGHLMLSSALFEMIDRCECFFFLDTDNSIYNKNDVVGENGFNENSLENEEGTFSPWIKLEIETTEMIQKKVPERVRIPVRDTNESQKSVGNENLAKMDPEVFYPLSLEHLKKINTYELERWFELSEESRNNSWLYWLELNGLLKSKTRGKKCLDELYQIVDFPPPKKK